MRTNVENLIKLSLSGKIHHPLRCVNKVDVEGKVWVLPTSGGITYNVKIGDSAFGWIGDHVEPGVSIKNENEIENETLNTLSCIGNTATIVSGDAKGEKGVVTGTHGGIEHVLIYFDEQVLEKLAIGDTIQIKSWGQGFALLDFPGIKIMNISPDMFFRIGIEEKEGYVEIPVTAKIPSFLMGSGTGLLTATNGDYDIMTSDKHAVEKYGIDKLRLGDLVLIEDSDTAYGRGYLQGAITIGIVIHTDCIRMGHGPGITTIATCKKELIKGIICQDANIINYIQYVCARREEVK